MFGGVDHVLCGSRGGSWNVYYHQRWTISVCLRSAMKLTYRYWEGGMLWAGIRAYNQRASCLMSYITGENVNCFGLARITLFVKVAGTHVQFLIRLRE